MDRGLDFLVEHGLKPYIELSFKPIHVSYTIYSKLAEKDNDIVFHDRDSYQKVMQDLASHLTNRYGMDEIESWYFELWKDERLITISNRNCINDSCAQGALVMKSCIESVGHADMMGYWHGSDLHSEYYDSEAVLYGDNGLLTRDGIKKPSFYAFHFLQFL